MKTSIQSILILAAFYMLCVFLTGCHSQSLDPANVDGTLRRVADRDDKYVNADPSLSDGQKADDLRDTALLRAALDQAESPPNP